MLRYCCERGQLDQAAPKCIAFGGVSVDEEIGRQLLRVVRPAAVEAALLAHQDGRHEQDEVRAALERDLEAARYAAQRAGKQFDAVDPENRLVADELEQRLAVDGDAYDVSASPTCEEFSDLARELEDLRRHGCAAREKVKRENSCKNLTSTYLDISRAVLDLRQGM